MKEFKLKQVGTQVPEENIQDVQVTLLDDGDIWIDLGEDGWIAVNLTDSTFAVGDYEG